jgi:hypothetical protein
MAADFGEMLAGMAQESVVFSSKRKQGTITVQACIGEGIRGKVGADDGMIGEDDLSLTVTHAALVAAGWVPTSGDVVTVAGDSYRVRRARRVTGDVVWSFDCESVAR